MRKALSALAAALIGVALLAAAPAKASTVALNTTTLSGTVLNLDITANNPDSVLTPGLDITAITGTVGGVAVSNYSGVWGGNGDQVSSGLYLDPFLNQNAPHVDGNGINVFTVQNPPGSGGTNFEIDNILYAAGPNVLSYQGGLGLLLANGESYYLSANGNPGNNGQGTGGYYDWLGTGQTSIPPSATPLPAALPMLASVFGIGGIVGIVRRKRKQKIVLVSGFAAA